MYNGKYTQVHGPSDVAEFLRGLSTEATALGTQHPDAVHLEDLVSIGYRFGTADGGGWQEMVGVLSVALVYPVDEPDSHGWRAAHDG